jgi:hypothetical protein
MSETTLASARTNRPVAFTQAELGWAPWLEPLSEEELTARHWAGLVDASRAKSPYFMLLARDPEILEARTKTDKDTRILRRRTRWRSCCFLSSASQAPGV